MTVNYADISQRLDEWRGFVMHDLQQITALSPGGNFAAVAVGVAACDRLAYMWHGQSDSGELVFERLVPTDLKPIAASLFNALRHGVVHHYEPMTFDVDGQKVNLAIGWDDGSTDWLVGFADGSLVINARGLHQRLDAVFDDYAAALRDCAELRDTFQQRSKRKTFHVKNPSELDAWKTLLDGVDASHDPGDTNLLRDS